MEDILRGSSFRADRIPRGLLRRLEEAGLPLPMVDDDRLLKEIAIFADRIDISEELTRLAGHLVEFARLLAADVPSGRNMDFLTQELNRELNTIGSKANNAAIAHPGGGWQNGRWNASASRSRMRSSPGTAG